MSNAMSLFNSNEETVMMNSLELRDLVNDARVTHDEKKVENSHFLKRVEDELEGDLGLRKLFVNPQGGRPTAYYDLTHDQCMLVGMRESKAVRRSVLDMLKAMKKQIQEPQLPDFTDPALMAREWATWFEKDKANREEVARLEHEAEIVKPKVAGYDALMNTTGTVTMMEIAHTLAIKGLGQKKLFEFLRNDGVLMKGNHPYQKDVNRGFFKTVDVVRNGRKFPTTVVFPRGVEYIVKRLRANGYDI